MILTGPTTGIPGQANTFEPYVPGYVYTRPSTNSGFSNLTPTQNQLVCEAIPIFGTKPVTISAWSLNCATLGAGEVLRIGLYTVRGFVPDELIVELGAFDVSSTGEKTLLAQVTLAPGYYGLASVKQGGTSSAVKGGSTTFDPLFGYVTNDPAASGVTSSYGGWTVTSSLTVSGALPRRFTPTVGITAVAIPRIHFRIGSV